MARTSRLLIPRFRHPLLSVHSLLSLAATPLFVKYLVGDHSPAGFSLRLPLLISLGLLALHPPAIEAQDSREAARHYRRGQERSARGDYDEAIAAFTAAIELISRPGGAPHRRRHEWRADDLSEASAPGPSPYRVVDPQAAQAYAARGLAHLRKKDYAPALADFDQALRLSPRLVEAYLHRGNARFDLKDYTGAVADYDRALRIDPSLAEAWSNRGNARYQQGDLRGALADYDRALALNPRLAAVYCNRGNTRRDAGDLAGALADFSRALEMEPRMAQAYCGRGTVYSDQGKFDESVADLNRAVEIDSRLALAYGQRGLVRLQRGEVGEAEEDFRRCLMLDPALKAELEARIERVKRGRADKR